MRDKTAIPATAFFAPGSDGALHPFALAASSCCSRGSLIRMNAKPMPERYICHDYPITLQWQSNAPEQPMPTLQQKLLTPKRTPSPRTTNCRPLWQTLCECDPATLPHVLAASVELAPSCFCCQNRSVESCVQLYAIRLATLQIRMGDFRKSASSTNANTNTCVPRQSTHKLVLLADAEFLPALEHGPTLPEVAAASLLLRLHHLLNGQCLPSSCTTPTPISEESLGLSSSGQVNGTMLPTGR